MPAAEPITARPILEMMDASVASPQRPDVADIERITWRVMPGEFWVVGGLHASGKTALITTAAGLQRPLHGSVLLFGHDLFGLREPELLEERKRIGVVFENGGRMFRNMTVSENVALPLRYHHNWTDAEAEGRVAELLRLAGLSNVAQHPVQSLPTISQQRAALARAVALRPEFLVVDKPLMSSRDQRWWPETLRKLAEGTALPDAQPMAIVATTEDLQPWADCAKQFAMLKNRQLHVLGTAVEMKRMNQPIHRMLFADENEE